MKRITLKVPLITDCTVVFAIRNIKFDSNPLSRGKLGFTDKLDFTLLREV
jgi:hypothetical protein